MLRIVFAALAVLSVFSGPALAQDGPVPDRRIAISRNVDFPGGDIRAIFDTNFEACARACLSDASCTAFTFNARSNSCFPKTAAGARSPYEGALSAVVLPTGARVLAAAAVRRAELAFLSDWDIENAREQAEGLANRHYVNDWTAEALLNGAREARAQGNLVDAMKFAGSALTLTDAADQWVDYADLLLSIRTDDRNQARAYRGRALLAAINGYLRAEGAALRATALGVMARALEANDRGRDMIPALRLAQQLSPRDDLAALLEDAIGKYGFRIAEHEVESDAAAPRICAVFTEDLVKAGVDYAPYVRLPEPGLSVAHEGRQLCIEGVAHGQRYRVTFRAGLPAASGETLARDVTLTQYVRDRAPSVRFPGRAYVLPKTGEAALPVVTVNTGKVALVLRRVSERNLLRAFQDNYFGRPLSVWEAGDFEGAVAEEIWTGTGETGMELNRDVTTRLPMGGIIGDLPAGIYALEARVPGADPYENAAAMQWFVVSDLGLATLSGTDGLHVFVRSLATAGVKEGVTVTLLSTANRVLGEAVTDADGYAHFAPGLTRGSGGAAPALITAQEGEGDIAFLSLTDPAFDLSDRGVEGREPAGPIDVFLATDRGAYRAGETVHATALTRDAQAAAIAGLPLTAILTRPDGLEYSRHLSQGGTAGGHVFDLALGAAAPRGTWTLALHADPDAAPLASQSFLVEDFLPERIDFDLALPDGPIRPTDRPELRLEARYLFGAPAGNLAVEGEVVLAPADTLDAWPGYRFGLHDEYIGARLSVLDEGLRTDAAGRLVTAITFPETEVSTRPLEARLSVRVSEGSGRPVERRLTRRLTPAGAMIGLKPRFDGVAPEGSEAGFDVIGIGADEAPAPMRVKWTLSRVTTRYQWYQLYGGWNWEPVTTRARVAGGEATMEGGRLALSAPVDWGEYELTVERIDGQYADASLAFHAGWYAPADATETPDTLELSLDKPAYLPGETATLRIVPRYAGKALVTVMSNHLIAMRPVDLAEGENIVTLPVTDEWGAGAYVSATLIRPMDAPAGRNPARALGLAYAQVDPGARQLSAAFDVAEEAAPRAPLEVALRVDGVTPGEKAYATIAAVDVGILNLTGFDSPDPSGHYFGQRKLGVGMRDLYGRLIDGMTGVMGAVRSGGDAGAQMRTQAPPPTEELVAYFSGPVTVGADGYARASFDLPAFNGTVRLMGVAWSKTGVGQAEAEVLVRDPVVVTASLPRFLAPGDRSRLLLEIVHATGPAGRMGLDVAAEGVTLDAAAIPSGVTLTEQSKATLSIPVTADETGVQTLRVALTTPDGRVLTKELSLPVQVNDPETTRSSRFTLGAGQSFSFGADVFAGLLPGTGQATLAIGPLARLDAPGLLRMLDTYPYGCTEQITSQAMPLLYLSSVAEAMGLASRDTTRERIAQSIDAVLANQSAGGAFGLWHPDSGDFWLDAYVTDFLSRARAEGADVPQTGFRLAMDNLRNRVNYAPDFDEGGEDIAYALMVLAREGAAAISDLRYYADVKADAFATPLAKAQLGAALASYGDQTRADAMFARAARQMAAEIAGGEPALWRADYGTARRDAAAVLTLAAEAGSAAVDRESLAAYAAGGPQARSTQEAMWTLMAANALIDRAGAAGFTIDGAPATGPLVRMLEDDAAVPVAFRNGSGRDAQLTLTTFGVPAQPEPAGGRDYAISRSYYTLEGHPVDPSTVAAGTRLVTALRIDPFTDTEARLMVSDPLPAGFEIDNPSLLRGGDIRALDWLEPFDGANRTEFRQDRFLAALDWGQAEPFTLAYIVRATAPGSYHHPAASVEDMYRPDRRAWTDAGRVTVTE
ncbi:alpha-2-macroglobulin family protein [Actibacterium sp. MT2.3-13A]|uniref:alpha-2-macroglobulin family protein n=1 Tax=Actibacterium sp. MT2.3-13A TaxID=2828332 RepID=UPI001BAE2F5A|nr:alpha-2-macroglobulin family protein [Actibacterium sp. MT2.3-13A]